MISSRFVRIKMLVGLVKTWRADRNQVCTMAQSLDMYGYLPSEPAALFGIIYFGISMIACVLQVVFGRYKCYWMILLAIAALGEAIGWGGRLWAHFAVSWISAQSINH